MTGTPTLAGAQFFDASFGRDFDARGLNFSNVTFGGGLSFERDYEGATALNLRNISIDRTFGLDLTNRGDARLDFRTADLRGLCGGAEALLDSAQTRINNGTQVCAAVRECLTQRGWDVNASNIDFVECDEEFPPCICEKIAMAAPPGP